MHPTGNPFARQAAIAFATTDSLDAIVTALAYDPQHRLARALHRLPAAIAQRLDRELQRRTWRPPAGVSLHAYPRRELARLALLKSGLARWLQLNPQSLADWVYAGIDRQFARRHLDGIDAVYAYEDAAATTFAAAKRRGLACFYDLPIAFYRHGQQVQAAEAERFPALAPVLQTLREPAWKLARKEQEVELADRILVPSDQVRRSLLAANIPAEKIAVVPFGAPGDRFQPRPKPDRTFRALFVGRVGPRKGVHYLLPAWQQLRLPDAELWLIGVNEFPPGWLAPYADCIRYIPSIPHATLPDYYPLASVFVFPSLLEGLALVLLEAMACGLPVIATAASGATELIDDGVEGWLIPSGDRDALAAKLAWCYEHPDELAAMGRAARRKAEQFTWARYRERLRGAIA